MRCKIWFLGWLLVLANLFSAPFAASAASDAAVPEGVVRLGVSDLSDFNPNNEIISATIALLQEKLGSKLKVIHYSVEGLVDAVRLGEVDATISSAGLHRASAVYGAKDLVSTAFSKGRDPNHCSASLFIVRADRTDLKTLADLKGKRAVATRPLSITGLIMALGEVESQGFDSSTFFSSIAYTGYPMRAVVDRVVDGSADVGLLWACFYEQLLADNYRNAALVKPFSVKTGDSLQCLHSTSTYPGHTVAVTPTATPEIARFLTQTLLAMPKTQKSGYFWTIATDFHAIEQLFKETKYGPYSYLREWTLKRVWEEYKLAIALLAAALVFWGFHTVRANQLVRQRTRLMQEAIESQQKAQAEALAKGERIQALERLGAVQQLSSMLAHELKQPLTAVGFYVDSLINRVQRGKLKNEVLLETLNKIQTLNTRSSELINHVRSYAKKSTVSREMMSLSDVIEAAARNIIQAQGSGSSSIDLELDLEPGLKLTADRLEIEVIVINLVKNAAQAVSKVPKPRISLQTRLVEINSRKGVRIAVTDNGRKLSQEEFQRLLQPFNSTRADGLGLGIAIVQRLAESYGGRICFVQLPDAGLRCEVFLFGDMEEGKANDGKVSE